MTTETAFHPRLAAMTDQWMDLFGYWAPTVVTTTGEEYRAVRERAGLMDFSMLRKVDLTGPGARDLVASVMTRDLAKLAPGHIAYGAIVDEEGRMVDDCTASVLGPDRVRFCGANDRDADLLAERAADSKVAVEVLTDRLPHLCVQGPASRTLLQPLADADLSNAAFPYYTCREGVSIGGIPVFMTRLGYTAELGYELWVGRDRALELWDLLVEAGHPHGMAVVGMDALDLLRIEGGFIIGGVEYDATTSPFECGLGWTVDLDRGDFLGKKALAADKEAIDVRLASVVLEEGGASATGAPLTVEGQTVGTVTQAISSPHLGGATLGLAKLRRPHNRRGTAVTARLADREVPGEVIRHPAYDPERKRVKDQA